MAFTIGYFKDGAHLAAVCNYCGKVVKAHRDEQNGCVVPDLWHRMKKSKVGTINYAPVFTSILACDECVMDALAKMIEMAEEV